MIARASFGIIYKETAYSDVCLYQIIILQVL
jgi:hypothetical protein